MFLIENRLRDSIGSDRLLFINYLFCFSCELVSLLFSDEVFIEFCPGRSTCAVFA